MDVAAAHFPNCCSIPVVKSDGMALEELLEQGIVENEEIAMLRSVC